MPSRVAGGSKAIVTSLLCSSAWTVLTPGSSPTSVWMVCTQCAHEMFGIRTLKVVIDSSSCDHKRPISRAPAWPWPLELGRRFKYVGDLAQHALALDHIFAAHGGDDARMQMAFEQQAADFVQGGFHRLDLFDDVDAVGVIFEHALDAFDVPGDTFHALKSVLLGSFHFPGPILPPSRGGIKLILIHVASRVNPAIWLLSSGPGPSRS